MNSTIKERVLDLERKVASLTDEIRGRRPVLKDWTRTIGMLPDDEMSREADRLGAEWREQQRDP